MGKQKLSGHKGGGGDGMTFQDLILNLSRFWAEEGCVLALPYDLEVGAGTMCPETFLRVLGPAPWRVAYVQPSRRPADGRYGENPNRLLKHTQMQVILKPPPDDVQDVYLRSLEFLGIDLRQHDIRFEEDNWEAPTLGAGGIGWQVVLDGLEITQFTYFQQCGGMGLDPVSVELTYGLERIAAFLQAQDSVYDIKWDATRTYGDLRREEELELSIYDFEGADSTPLWDLFKLYESEAKGILGPYEMLKQGGQAERVALRKAFEYCLKCSHIFNILDARGVVSVTERVSLIGRVRRIACSVAEYFLDREAEAREARQA